jgi:hypothetical protein
MSTFSLSWDAVTGASGYNIHSRQESSGIYTDVTDVGNVLFATITVSWQGPGFASIAPYNAGHIEGAYSQEFSLSGAPFGTPVLSVR